MRVLERSSVKKIMMPLFNMGFRGLGLVGRFALSIYLVKYLDLESVGLFGLVSGAIGLVPALIGLGINYFFSRSLVGKTAGYAGAALKNRLLFTLLAGVVPFVGFVVAQRAGLVHVSEHVGVLALIYLGELWAVDLHQALINLKKPVLANALLFVRSALWIFPFMAVGWFFPAYRTFDSLLCFWAAGLVACYATLFVALRKWPWRDIAATPVSFAPFVTGLRKRSLVYLSDIGLAGSIYLDRFVVQGFLGLEMTGVFMFFWTIANAVQLLVSTAVTQIAAPHLVEAYQQGREDAWRKLYRRETIKAVGVGVGLSLLVFGGVWVALPYLARPELARHMDAFVILLLATNARAFSNLSGLALFSRHKDNAYAVWNIAGLGLGVGFSFVGIWLHGLLGLCWSVLFSVSLVAVLKEMRLRKECTVVQGACG